MLGNIDNVMHIKIKYDSLLDSDLRRRFFSKHLFLKRFDSL